MATDINLDWTRKSDPVLLHDEQVFRQAIYNILFFSKNEIYYGAGNEIDLKSKNFELIPYHGDDLTIRGIAEAIRTMDRRFRLLENRSSITPVGDQYQLHLVVEYGYTEPIVIDQRIQKVEN